MGMMIGQHCPKCRKYVDQVIISSVKNMCPFCKHTGEFFANYNTGKLEWTWDEVEDKKTEE